jgi:hypothetical protein
MNSDALATILIGIVPQLHLDAPKLGKHCFANSHIFRKVP